MVRREDYKPTKALWIFCEGKCEKSYFDKLKFEERISRLKIRPIKVGHRNADGIIQEAIDFKHKKNDFQKNDLIVCVFDRDANTNEQLNKAKKLAEKNSILVGFSNPCFEYWFLCHYDYFPSAYEKDSLHTKVKEFIPKYKKNDSEPYLKTRNNLSKAVHNAEKIMEMQLVKKIELICKESNPLTLVFQIIKKINEFRD